MHREDGLVRQLNLAGTAGSEANLGGELEQLLRAYRSRKAALANPSSADSDIFGEEGK